MTHKHPFDVILKDADDMDAMEDDGWICNERGWWHPPSCVASWPFKEAREAWRKDREKKLKDVCK